MIDTANFHNNNSTTNQKWLIENYFSDTGREICLKKGDILLKQNQLNQRLFWVQEGNLTGVSVDGDGNEYVMLRAHKNMFIGIASFFSSHRISMMTVSADGGAVVRYMERNQPFIEDGKSRSMADQFQDLIINELVHRQAHLFKMAVERESTLKMLAHHEKMATLGKISAGIAHELNNAIAVLKRNAEWLSMHLESFVETSHPDYYRFIKSGLEKGRFRASSEIRKRTIELGSKYRLQERHLKRIAAMGVDDAVAANLAKLPIEELERIQDYWESGVSLNDMLVAADHATHVVKSIKALGAPQSERQSDVNLNQCAQEAVTLLSSSLRKVNVKMSLQPIPFIFANKGEWVEIFMNLIQNACDCLISSKVENPVLEVATEDRGGCIVLAVSDNGPGISPGLLPRIFDPSVTTKSGGLTFGLGLGLTIAERLVERYKGRITVKSEPGNTRFCIEVPLGGNK